MQQTNLEFHSELKLKKHIKHIKHTDHNNNRRIEMRYNVAKDCIINGYHCRLMNVSRSGLGIDICDGYKVRVGDIINFNFVLSKIFFCCAKGVVVRTFLIPEPGITKRYKKGHLGLGIHLFYKNENFKEFTEFITTNSVDAIEMVE